MVVQNGSRWVTCPDGSREDIDAKSVVIWDTGDWVEHGGTGALRTCDYVDRWSRPRLTDFCNHGRRQCRLRPRSRDPGGVRNMATIIAFHEVDNVDHWLHSPKRQEFFGPMGITGQLFTDPANSNRVGLIVNVPDLEAFQKAMQSEEAADAMRFDGVRPETLLILEQASDHL